jgi:hypothetical protein
MSKASIPFNERPLRYGEESAEYQRLYSHYTHVGCPGDRYEDNCIHASECALRGKCRLIYEEVGALSLEGDHHAQA